MTLKLEGFKTENASDELIQQLMFDILTGLKKKLVQPLHEGNRQLAYKLEEIKAQDQAGVAELAERMESLEKKVQQVPFIILSAIRDAINEAGGGDQNDR